MRKYFCLWKRISTKALMLAVIAAAALNATACGNISVIKETKSEANNMPQINPLDGIHYISSVELYYRFCQSAYLVPLKVDVNFSSNERAEAALLRALLSGKGKNGIYTTAIPEETELINIMESGDTLFITLNDAFLDDSLYASDDHKRIATCEIINTLSAYSDSSIQILVDRSGNGTGERVSYKELGFEEKYDEKTDYAAPFSFTKSIVVTPAVVADYALGCIKNGEYDEAAPVFISDAKKRGLTGDDIMRFASDYIITDYEIVYTDETSNAVYVFCKIKFIDKKTQIVSTFNVKLELEPYNLTYRIPYEKFTESIGGAG